MIIQNALKISEPDKPVVYLISQHRHDFRSYEFANGGYLAVDGGCDYFRRIREGAVAAYYEDWSLESTDPIGVIRKRLLWGTLGKDGKGPLSHLPLAECSVEHLKNILAFWKTKPLPLTPLYAQVIKYWINKKTK